MRDDPTNKVRVMQINSATTIPFVPVTTGTSGTRSSSPATATAQSPLQLTSPTFSSMVEEAKSYPEVRSEVVAAYKAQVASVTTLPRLLSRAWLIFSAAVLRTSAVFALAFDRSSFRAEAE